MQASTKADLNLVLCGSDAALKSSVSKCFRGSKTHPIEFSSGCVMEEEKIDGCLISLVQLPALSRLSEEEVMRHTLNCVSLCDPGVHVFLLIVSDAPLTDEDKAEIEKVQKIFDSREHFMLLFTTDLTVGAVVTDLVKSRPESQRLIRLCGGQYRMMGLNESESSRQIPELLDYIENMNTKPYTLQMYMKAQENRVRRETEEKYEEKLKRIENENKELKQNIPSEGADGEADDQECLRIVLIGRTGSGKSATGNTILGRTEFQSQLSTDSVTTVCEKGVGQIDGRSVAVVDTPGLFDTTLTNDQVAKEIVKCVSMSSPGPHVFVIVLSLVRLTKEEIDSVDLIKKIFGPKSAQFSIYLFTRRDELENESIEDYVKRSKSAELQKVIRDCGNRFLAFNNKEKQDRTQVIQLLNMIEEVKNANQGRYFTNSMFEETEMSIKKRMEQILKEREKEIQTQKDELQAKYDLEMITLKKKLEEEKERANEERVKIENQFREKEEKLRKEFEEKEKTEQKEREIEKQKQSEEEHLRSEYHQKIEEMKREIENQRSQYEKQQKEREEEDRKREEKYRQEQEKMKHQQEHILAELQMRQEEEVKKQKSEQQKRNEEEEEEKQRWKRKIKEAEHDRKEIKEEIKRQQREWEDEKKRQMREREEEERKKKEKHEEQLREKQEELENMRKKFEREREAERQKIEDERQKQTKEREEKEREYKDKKLETKRYYDQLEQERKEEWERRKREDDERREEERRRWKEMIEDLRQEREEEMKRRESEEKDRKEREEKKREEIKQKHEEEIKAAKKKHIDEARKQAEEFNKSTERKHQHVLELTEMLKEHQEQYELLEKLYQLLKEQQGEEIKELKQEVEKLNNKSSCDIL